MATLRGQRARQHSARITRRALVAAVLLTGACRSDDGVARLLSHDGEVSAERPGGSWQPVARAQRFQCDEGLRTGAGAWARVAIRDNGRARLEPDTIVRFRCNEGGATFDVEVGEAVVIAAGGNLAFDLEIGRATLKSGGEISLRAGDGKTRFEVIVGSAVVERADGSTEDLEPGQYLEIEVGRATIRRNEPVPVDAGAPDAGDAGAPDAGASDAGPGANQVIVQLRGRAGRMRPSDGGRFRPLRPGEHPLEPGALLRLARRSTAELARGPEQATITGPAEIVIGAPDGELFDTRRGEVTLQASELPVRVRVPGGTVEARGGESSGSRARLEVDGRRSRVRAVRGMTDVTGKSGSEESLQIGERVVLAHNGRIEVYGRAPARAEVTITAGESPTIHDPKVPTAVGVGFGDQCADTGGEAILEVAPRRGFTGEITISKGTGRANVLLDSRRIHHYRVRCLSEGTPGKPVESGRIRVLRDRATRRLPRKAPHNTIDADGRAYTVLYQNLLPEITFRWPRAADAGPYRLHLEPPSGQATTLDSPKPAKRTRSGELREGTYRYFFESNGKRSKVSTLSIEFDNAAPSAYLSAPKVGQPWTGGTLEIAGAALPGSRVRVAGNDVDTDRKGRFSATVSLPVPGGIVFVRTVHPKAGIHYYLRRAPGAR